MNKRETAVIESAFYFFNGLFIEINPGNMTEGLQVFFKYLYKLPIPAGNIKHITPIGFVQYFPESAHLTVNFPRIIEATSEHSALIYKLWYHCTGITLLLPAFLQQLFGPPVKFAKKNGLTKKYARKQN